MAKITYTDKVGLTPNPLPDENKWSDVDCNQVKTVVNQNEYWRGAWAGTTALPVDADAVGSGTAGAILAGNTFVFTNQVVFGGSVFPAKSIAVALQNTPTTLAHWSILAAQT